MKETLATGAYTQSVILTCGTAGEQSCPSSVAVDGSGDVFVAAYNSSQITKLTPSLGGYTQSTIDASLNGPSSIVVDGLGNLYVADTLNSRAVELALTANGYVQSTVTSSALDQPLGVAVDQLGNVYIADTEHQRVLKEDISGTPELSFALTYFGATSSDSPKTEQVLNYGNEVLAITGLSYPPDFPEANDDANACTTSTSLSANQECDLPIDFTPGAEYGLPDTVQLSEDVTITDNALNVSGAQQSVAVNGSWWWDEGCGCAFYLTVAAPSNVVAGVPFDITVTAYFIGVVLDYNGFITYSSTDPSSVLPPEYQGLTNGVGTFKVTLQTPGIQTITATEEDSITGTSGSINVTAATHVAASEGSMNFGSRVIGSASGAETLNFSISAGTTVGSIAVLTQGAPNMDFTQATGSTCTAAVYASTTSCTVNVIFTPKAAGLRLGAVVFFSEGGNTGMQLASLPVSGSGTGAQVAYGPSTATAIDPGVNGASLSDPLGVAVDGLGDLFIADSYPNPRVVKVPAGGGAATAISPALDGMGLLSSWGLAVDGAGDLFIASTWWAGDGYAQEWGVQVIEAPAGGGLAKAIRPGLYLPTDIAVNGAGDLFIADSGNSRVVKVQAGGGAATTIAPTVNGLGLNTPYGVAVDGAGDLFVVDTGNNRVVEIPAGGEGAIAIAPTVGGIAFNAPEGIAVDAAGDLFIADTNNNRVVEVPAGGGAAIAIAPVVNGLGLNGPAGIAVDGTGNLFITDSNNNRVVRIQRSQPPAVNFPTVTSVGSIDTKDGTQTVQIFNIGNVALDLTALSYPADFSKAGGDANACTGSTSLSPGAECDVPIEFTPENFGSPLSEDVTLTDNALSGAGAKQSIAVTGQSQPAAAALSLPNPGSVLAGPEVTFSWAPVTGATGYTLKLGTALGSTNLWNAGEQKATSQEIGNLPTNGEPSRPSLYVLWQCSDV